jgi:hypothetical protein
MNPKTMFTLSTILVGIVEALTLSIACPVLAASKDIERTRIEYLKGSFKFIASKDIILPSHSHRVDLNRGDNAEGRPSCSIDFEESKYLSFPKDLMIPRGTQIVPSKNEPIFSCSSTSCRYGEVFRLPTSGASMRCFGYSNPPSLADLRETLDNVMNVDFFPTVE